MVIQDLEFAVKSRENRAKSSESHQMFFPLGLSPTICRGLTFTTQQELIDTVLREFDKMKLAPFN